MAKSEEPVHNSPRPKDLKAVFERIIFGTEKKNIGLRLMLILFLPKRLLIDWWVELLTYWLEKGIYQGQSIVEFADGTAFNKGGETKTDRNFFRSLLAGLLYLVFLPHRKPNGIVISWHIVNLMMIAILIPSLHTPVINGFQHAMNVIGLGTPSTQFINNLDIFAIHNNITAHMDADAFVFLIMVGIFILTCNLLPGLIEKGFEIKFYQNPKKIYASLPTDLDTENDAKLVATSSPSNGNTNPNTLTPRISLLLQLLQSVMEFLMIFH